MCLYVQRQDRENCCFRTKHKKGRKENRKERFSQTEKTRWVCMQHQPREIKREKLEDVREDGTKKEEGGLRSARRADSQREAVLLN